MNEIDMLEIYIFENDLTQYGFEGEEVRILVEMLAAAKDKARNWEGEAYE